MPALSTLQPANVATPATAAFGLAVQVRIAPLAVVSARVTELVSPVTVFPNASCTVTTGWVAIADWLVEPLGCVVKPTLAAAAAVIVKLLLVAEVSPPALAVSV